MVSTQQRRTRLVVAVSVVFATLVLLYFVVDDDNIRTFSSQLASWTWPDPPPPKIGCVWPHSLHSSNATSPTSNDTSSSSPQSNPSSSQQLAFQPIELPTCLQKWHDASRSRVRKETQQFLTEYTASRQEQHCVVGHAQAVYEPGDPFHQPWWGGLFFYYVSMMLWQDFIFEKKSCIRYLMLDEEAPTLWSGVLHNAPTWTAQTANRLKPYMGEYMVTKTCAVGQHHVHALNVTKFTDENKNRSGWFIDGSDAYWLGSALLREADPCAGVQGRARQLLQKSSLEFTLVQRKWARRFTNVDSMLASVRRFSSLPHAHNTTFNVSVVDFEGLSMLQQVQAMRATDVIISVHGAGLTNIAWMRPCSVVIEVMPFGLDIPREDLYFKKLANSVDVLHYFWTADKDKTSLMPGANVAGGRDCKKRYNFISADPEKGYHECYFDKYCRACAKLTALAAEPAFIEDRLTHAIRDRKQCIKHHPLYSS